jgi:6-phosphogluconolactonase (cycloisomerase 2 family)
MMRNDDTMTRRNLIAGAAVIGSMGIAQAAPTQRPAHGGSVFGYVGSYTDASTPAGNGKGITLVRLDTGSGEMTPVKVFPAPSPSWLAIDSEKKFLYAVSEIDSYGADKTGAVTAYALDRATGELSQINTVSSRGKGPAHGSVHPSGKFVFVANYGSGTVAVLPVATKGSLGEAVDVRQDEGPAGAFRPAEGPPGNYSISDHNGPHAHMMASDPTGRFAIVNDLGLDRTFIWKLDLASGKLTANNPPFIPAASAGAGPRHFAFHPNGRVFYNLYEEASQLVVYDWNPQTAAVTLRQKVTTVPGYAGTTFASEIVVSPDARFLYVGNRLHNTIGIFAIAADGQVKWVGEEWTRGDYPRNIALDPTGNFMVACNHRSDQVTVFRVDRATGRLRFTNQYLAVGSPSMVAFLG